MVALTEEERLKAERAVAAASLVDFKYQVFEYSAIQFSVTQCNFFRFKNSSGMERERLTLLTIALRRAC